MRLFGFQRQAAKRVICRQDGCRQPVHGCRPAGIIRFRTDQKSTTRGMDQQFNPGVSIFQNLDRCSALARTVPSWIQPFDHGLGRGIESGVRDRLQRSLFFFDLQHLVHGIEARQRVCVPVHVDARKRNKLQLPVRRQRPFRRTAAFEQIADIRRRRSIWYRNFVETAGGSTRGRLTRSAGNGNSEGA